MSGITISSLTKVFRGGVKAVDDVSLEIDDGEFMVLVGPSGCGKTTLLRMVAGLENATSGRISIAGRDVTNVPAGKRDVAMVFQNYALYPHMNVRANLAYGLKVRRIPRSEIKRRVEDIAAMLGLDEMLDRRPGALSGGQRQRVAIGRAIVREPEAFLLDEPLSNLDAKLRVGMRGELARLHSRLGVTTVYVTHDQVEAMTLGNRVAVMHGGTVQQVDAPQELYRNPANLFVAAFIGSPSMNLFDAVVHDGTVEFAGHTLPLPPNRRPHISSEEQVVLGIRPEHLKDAEHDRENLPQIEVSVMRVEELGSTTDAIFLLDQDRLQEEIANPDVEEATLLADDRRTQFTAKLDPSTRARAGERLRLCVDTSHLHFFDRESGASLRSHRSAAHVA